MKQHPQQLSNQEHLQVDGAYLAQMCEICATKKLDFAEKNVDLAGMASPAGWLAGTP